MPMPLTPGTAEARHGFDWPTALVAGTIYGAWSALTLWHDALPLPVLLLLGGWIVAWHGSLQHETIHGHPTSIPAINQAIGFVPLSLWLPYACYRRSHIAHHASPAITDPLADPESRYVDRHRGVAWLAARLQSTLFGHMLIGPPIAIVRFLIDEGRRAALDPGAVLRDWVPHLGAVMLLLAWLDWVGLGLASYCAYFVYPGMALTALRSHAEHRADLTTPSRAATVERGGLLALLFLNNNLHAAHHARPGLAWYRLPAYHRRNRTQLIPPGAVVYDGYGQILRRFALRSHDAPLHPTHRTSV
ncbi:fatty acid desaturase [Sphingomonas sp. TF3]|uniref:fatty acid desaturase n=1 Tax=Sphingomonas sp. TF3 TaxID=2495580 RepID=UPI0021AFAEB7|nr:fatty acid desaturase [Sphingomonas sp. TF3]